MRAARVMVVLAVLVVAGQAAAGAYVLRPGETLSGVAARNQVSVADLAQANGVTNPDRVLAGTSLRIPGGPATAGTPAAGAGSTAYSVSSSYVVRAGDNLETLARRFGTTTKALAAANGVRDPNLVVIGSKLKLPPGIRYESRPDNSLGEMLISGEIDAALSAHPPECFDRSRPRN